uniref:Transcription factor IIA gamma subunit n=1 Tax=Trypanosoma congolense (strain IL3000) TaxID=1068625 RepID=G0UW74_TRYCI|nr:conserved hypothetical protein [Trypanosoma congolense IL3000]
MYRESLLGVALGATLAELESVCRLTEGQKQYLWEVFDIAMDRTLAEAPVTSQVRVFTSPPTNTGVMADNAVGRAAAEGDSVTDTRLLTSPARVEFPSAATAVQTTPNSCTVLSDEVTYPVYRVKDGLWTILLKDPTLELTDVTGSRESIQLDYLKVYLKDVAESGAVAQGASSRRKRRR